MPHTYSTRIYYDETDAGGVVYYGRYLGLLERARTEFLIDNGISISKFHEMGLFFVIAHVDIHYRKPARLGDIISITTEVMQVKNTSVLVKNRVFRDDTPLVEADVTIVCVNRDGRPQRLPDMFKPLAPKAE